MHDALCGFRAFVSRIKGLLKLIENRVRMKITDFINEELEKPIGLFSGYLFFSLLFISLMSVFPTISPFWAIIVLAIIIGLWTITWLIIRASLPRNTKNKIGIILSISTEDDKQKLRIKNDFLNRLKSQTKQNGLDDLINFVHIGSTKTQNVNMTLTEYTRRSKFKDEYVRDAADSTKSFLNMKKKIRGHFYIWGGIKQRMDGENKYYLDLDGLVIHSPLHDPIKAKLSSEFNLVWTRSINFMEKIEFKGFLLSADLIFIAIEYIIGLAAYFSGDIILAEKLHSKLESNLPKGIDQLPNIKHIRDSLSELIPIECNLAAVIQMRKNDMPKAEEYLNKSFQRLPERNYSALITLSVIQFSNKANAPLALETIRKAKKCSGSDGTWRYNEAFLLMFLMRFDEALQLYKDITKISFQNEETVLAEVLDFNKNIVSQNSRFYQSYFILGYLYYKKISNYPEGYLYFEQFLNLCKDHRFKKLIDLAFKYSNDLHIRMSLK